MQDYASKSRCLTKLTQKDAKLDWNRECEDAYENLVKIISSDPVLRLLISSYHSSSTEMHRALLYKRDFEKPASQQPHEFNFHEDRSDLHYHGEESASDAEGVEVLSFLKGSKFKLFTAHQALTFLLKITELK